MLAAVGWDSVTLDMQHGDIDYRDAVGIFTAVAGTPAISMVRVPWNDPALIMRLLDAGCYGIVCPMVNTAAEAQTFVGACRYPPAGYRSYGPGRAMLYAGRDYFQHANDTILTVAIIETEQAVRNLDSILATTGLDAVYIGSVDLAISLGKPPVLDHSEPTIQKISADIIQRAHERGKRVFMHALADEDIEKVFAVGADAITLSSDLGFMMAGAARMFRLAKERRGQGVQRV